MTAEADRSGQSSPGFRTASAKVLRWPELMNRGERSRQVEGWAAFPESQGKMHGAYSELDGLLFLVPVRAGQHPGPVSTGADGSAPVPRGHVEVGGNGEEVEVLGEPGSEAFLIWC